MARPVLSSKAVSDEGPTDEEGLQGLRVVLVEDNPDFREMLEGSLHAAGATVEAHADAASLVAATRVPEAPVPDAVVADLGLPGMTGFELARFLRQAPRLRDVLLIALTGYGGRRVRAEALDAGFDVHLVKPVRTRELVALMRSRVPSPGST